MLPQAQGPTTPGGYPRLPAAAFPAGVASRQTGATANSPAVTHQTLASCVSPWTSPAQYVSNVGVLQSRPMTIAAVAGPGEAVTGQQHLAELGAAFNELEHMDESASMVQAQLGSQMQSQLLNVLGPTADTPRTDFASWGASPSQRFGLLASSPKARAAYVRAADLPVPDASYVGPRLEPVESHITAQWAMQVVWHFQRKPREPLPARYLCRLLEEAEHHLDVREESQGPIQCHTLKPNDPKVGQNDVQLIVVGDTHGQLADVLWIFYKLGVPSPSNRYLFNGDICDRGNLASEIWAILLAFMCVWPESVSIQRGNHEDRLLNMDAHCGGFYEEVLQKYGRADGIGSLVYEKFARIFARLPLASVIADRVFVVHGGLSRSAGGGFLRLLRSNRSRTGEIPSASMNASPADIAFVDAMWADPQEALRVAQNPRGAGLASFGPDVTARFLAETGLSLVVRSHQVPPNNEGYFVQHGGKLVTVFSASNYCGIAGNTGAALVFRAAGACEALQHWAPPLAQISEVQIEPPEDREATPSMLRRSRLLAKQSAAGAVENLVKQAEASPKETSMRAERLEREVVRAATRLVVEKKQALFAYWEDCDKFHKPFITKKEWDEGIRAVLGDNIPWTAIGRALRVKDTLTKDVDYRMFLSRFRVVVAGGHGFAGGDRWAEELLGRFYGRLLALRGDAGSLEELEGFLGGGDGQVSPSDALEAFRWVLGNYITEEQATALLRTLAAHTGPDPSPAAHRSMGVFEFLSRLDVCFRHQESVQQALAGQEQIGSQGGLSLRPTRETTPWVRSVLAHLGRLVWMEDAGGSPKAGSTRMLEIFKHFDADGDGLLRENEFGDAVRTLLDEYKDSLPEALVADPVSDLKVADLVQCVDISGDGLINYLEFLHAFQPVDRTPGKGLQMDLMEQICTVVWANKPSLLRTMQVLEERCGAEKGFPPGRISREGLRQTLRTLNASLGAARGGDPEHGAPLTEVQIAILVDHAAFDHEDTVDHQEFLDAFQIVDTGPQATEDEEDATPASPPVQQAGGATFVLAGRDPVLAVPQAQWSGPARATVAAASRFGALSAP